jgi:uncharacterized membrane protein YjgN (DUF898 family)
MENTNLSEQHYKLNFGGTGREYFGVVIVNWLLTIITLGLYYPWAKAKQLNYLYNSTTLNGDNLSFNGTGKEMFIGFIKTIILFGIIFSIPVIFAYFQMPITGVLLFYACIIAIVPLAIHGGYRYRLSRSTWRGIRFGYRGNKKDIILNFYKWVFFTIITFGIYGSWLVINLRTYLISNIRLGSLEFKYKGNGGDYFFLNLKGYFLTILTLGIYAFWWHKERFAYFVDNITVNKGEHKLAISSKASGVDFLKLSLGNFFILIFTLGLGYAWTITRTLSLVASKINIDGDVDLNEIKQTEENYSDAVGEDIGDFLDLNLIM